jgi:serine/threonine-protein kinase
MANPPDSFFRSFRPPVGGEIIEHDGRTFRIHEQLGAGAFGQVFACSDDWGNELAAKVLVPKGRTFREVHESWEAELLALLTVRHPNITFVHDAFVYEDTFYIIVERCVWPVASLLQGAPAESWVPYIARDLLQAVSFVHGRGYIHKDIHAGNVFVFQAKDSMVPEKPAVWSFKLGDFGISRLAHEIHSDAVMAQWMFPPEAIRPAQFGAIGTATDIYHSALLLLSFVLGRQIEFTEEQIVSGYPRQLAEQTGSRYAGPLGRALRRHVSSRTPSALEFWRDLRAAAGAP